MTGLKHSPKTPIALAIALTLAGASSAVGYAAQKPEATADKAAAETNAINHEKSKLLMEKRQQISKDAREVIIGTQNALMALDKNDAKKARTQLQDVLGKLDILLAKYTNLKLVPADVSAQIYDLENSYDQVKKMVDDADDLLDDHKIQDARQILNALVSEIRVSTVNIPLGTYPIAIKEAVVQIDANKPENAKIALENVLGMLVNTTEVFSLPVLEAESMLTAASELEHKSDLSKDASRQEVLKLIDAAKDKLKLAEILGYGTKDDYQSLYNDIDEISDVIHSEKSAATWEKVKTSIASFKDKIARHL